MHDGWGSDAREEEICGLTSLSQARAQHFRLVAGGGVGGHSSHVCAFLSEQTPWEAEMVCTPDVSILMPKEA